MRFKGGRTQNLFTVSPRSRAEQVKPKSGYDRLRERGMLTKKEAAARLNIHEQTLVRWVECGVVISHAYSGHRELFELPEADLP